MDLSTNIPRRTGRGVPALMALLIFQAGCAGVGLIPVRLYEGVLASPGEGLAEMRIVSPEGKVVRTLWQGRGVGTDPVGYSWDGRGEDGSTLASGDYRVVLTVRDWTLENVGSFGGLGSTPGRFLDPKGLCAYPQGSRLTVAVADTGNQRVQLLTDTGGFLQSAGDFGSGDGKLDQPTDVDWDGQVLTVCDSRNHRLVRFDSRGAYLGEVRRLSGLQSALSTSPVLEFENPVALRKDAGGTFWVSDGGRGLLFHITATGGLLEQWGHPFALGNDGPFLFIPGGEAWIRVGRGQVRVLGASGRERGSLEPVPPFKAVAGMAVSPAGFALVSDPERGLLYFLDPQGKSFKTVPVPGVTAPGALSLWEDTLFTVDQERNMVAVCKLASRWVERSKTVKVERTLSTGMQ